MRLLSRAVSKSGQKTKLDHGAVLTLLETCFSQRSGGFSSIVGGTASLSSTAYALRCLEFLDGQSSTRSLVSLYADEALRFVDECWKGGESGYALSAALLPTAFGTKYAAEIADRVWDRLPRSGKPRAEETIRRVAGALASFRRGEAHVYLGYRLQDAVRSASTYVRSLESRSSLPFMAVKNALLPFAWKGRPEAAPKYLWKLLINAAVDRPSPEVVLSRYPMNADIGALVRQPLLPPDLLRDAIALARMFDFAARFAEENGMSVCGTKRMLECAALCSTHLVAHLYARMGMTRGAQEPTPTLLLQAWRRVHDGDQLFSEDDQAALSVLLDVHLDELKRRAKSEWEWSDLRVGDLVANERTYITGEKEMGHAGRNG